MPALQTKKGKRKETKRKEKPKTRGKKTPNKNRGKQNRKDSGEGKGKENRERKKHLKFIIISKRSTIRIISSTSTNIFNTLTTRDLVDIKAYLDATPPVAQANRANSMMFPFNWRFLHLGWRMMFFHFQKHLLISGRHE